MSQQMSLERMIADWMSDEARGRLPDVVVDEMVRVAVRQRPLPRWKALFREPGMRTGTGTAVGVPIRLLALAVLAALLAALLAVAVAGALLRTIATADDWPGYRGDATHRATAASGPIGNPLVKWTAHVPAGIENALSVARDLVLVPSDDGVLQALSIADGSERWRFSAPDPMNGPYVVEDTVYVADGEGVIHALDLADGRQLWGTGQPLVTPSDLIVVNGRLLVGTGDGFAVSIDARTGEEAWRVAISPGSRPVHGAAAIGGSVAVATDDGVVAVLEAIDGAVRWRAELGQRETFGVPVVDARAVYIGGGALSLELHLIAFDIQSGRKLWQIDRNVYSASVADGVGYTGSAVGLLAAVDLPSGRELWIRQFQGIVRAPAVAGDIVYASVDGERRLVGLDRASGGQLWSLDLDGANSCCIAVARGLVILGTSAGTVYAIGGDGVALTPAPLAPSPVSPTITVTPGPTRSAASRLDTQLVWAATSGATDFIPWGLRLSPDGHLWAVEADKDQFSIFTTDGDYVESWGRSGTGEGEFDLTAAHDNPYGTVAFAGDGSFYVLDAGNHRVQHFDSERRFLNGWGRFGEGPREFDNAVGIAVGAAGVVYVLDDARDVIEAYDASGRVLSSIPVSPREVGPNDGANSLAIGPNDHFYAAQFNPNQVVEIDKTGALVATYGGPSAGEGALNDQPSQMAFDAQGRLYVTHGSRPGELPEVSVYDRTGSYVGSFGPTGAGKAELGFAWGIVVTSDGIYVADAGALPGFGYSSYIRKFTPLPN